MFQSILKLALISGYKCRFKGGWGRVQQTSARKAGSSVPPATPPRLTGTVAPEASCLDVFTYDVSIYFSTFTLYIYISIQWRS